MVPPVKRPTIQTRVLFMATSLAMIASVVSAGESGSSAIGARAAFAFFGRVTVAIRRIDVDYGAPGAMHVCRADHRASNCPHARASCVGGTAGRSK